MLEQRRDRSYYPESETQGEKSGKQQEPPRMLLFADNSYRSLRERYTMDSTFFGCGNQGLESTRHLPKVIRLVIGGPKRQTRTN